MTQSHKILFIDDDETILKSFMAYFEDNDHKIFGAFNGKEGIELIESQQPDIIVTDMRMPVMDGLDVLRWLKEKKIETPIIIVSGAGDINLVVEALRLGAWDFIIKPVTNLSVLEYAISNSLEKSNLQKENKRYSQLLESLVNERTEKLHNANLALFESEKQYRLLAENVADIIWLRDVNLDIIYISPSIINLTGFSVDEYLIISNKEKDQSLGVLQKIMDEEQQKNTEGFIDSDHIRKFETLVDKKDGNKLWVENNVRVIRDEKGKVINLLGVSRDITERKVYEEELKKARDFAEENDQLKTAFLNNLSHEIRTPLNVIQGYVGLLIEEFKDASNVKEFTGPILRNSDQLLKIIDDILNISIIDTGQISISRSAFNANELVEQLIAEQKLRVSAKKISVKFVEKLLNADSQMFSDKLRIKQVLNNLISNAIRFTDNGFVNIGITKKENQITFYVEDSGIGIDKKDFERIFGRFQRIEINSDNRYHSVTHGGTGLGLAISKGLAEILGGSIWLKSEIGKGSTFYFEIPIIK